MNTQDILNKYKLKSLQDVDLRGANLQGANLQDVDLRGAYLRGANLQDVDLRGANLQGAYLRGANLQDVDLRGANLQGANLREANLQDDDLLFANLQGANLRDANLRGADLLRCTGDGEHILSLQTLKYEINYTSDIINIGCQSHSYGEWSGFSDGLIHRMDTGALEWWKLHKEWIFKAIELNPAKGVNTLKGKE